MRDYDLDVCATTRVPRASRSIPSAMHVIAAPADVCLCAGRCMCAPRTERGVHVLANGGRAAVPQVKAILKVRFRFVSREFTACER